MERFLVGSALVVAALIAAGSIFGTQSFEFRIDDDDKPAAVQGAPAAQGVETRYTAQSFDLRGAAAVLVVTPEDRTDIAVKITGGAKLPPRALTPVRGVAMGGDHGVKSVELSADGGANWLPAQLGPDHGRWAFRRFLGGLALPAGKHIILARATNAAGEAQPLRQNWNPSGYNRAGIDPVPVEIL